MPSTAVLKEASYQPHVHKCTLGAHPSAEGPSRAVPWRMAPGAGKGQGLGSPGRNQVTERREPA